jgi:DNA-directed RNA polymerase specialized sigma24 family protein
MAKKKQETKAVKVKAKTKAKDSKDKPKKKVYKEQYYTLGEEEMQALIQLAKRGDDRAQNELLKVFDNFLKKYVNLLYYNKYNLSDYDIRKFVALFVKDSGVRYYLVRNKMNKTSSSHVKECVSGIVYMANRYGDPEDVRQTVQLTFLQCVTRYERKGPIPFSGFLYSYFFYMLKKNVDQLLIDQLGRKTFPLATEEDRSSDDDEPVVGFTAPPLPSAEELIGPDEIDELWVAGDTALPPFSDLTIQERQLIKWRFIDGYKSSQIARRITEHPNTVREHFNKIRSKITDIVGEDIEYLLG